VVKDIGRLHVLTDTADGRDPLPEVEAALGAGAPVIQVRAKALTDRDLYAFAHAVATRCRAAGATCLIDDRADVAVAVGADGVHVGDEDLPIAAVRQVLGPDAIVGATARDPEAGTRLVAEGADYLGVGPTYTSTTKDGLPDPLGPAGVGAVASAVAVPVIAIAGITAARAPEVIAAGAHGIAVVAAVSRSPDPAEATRELLRVLP
jgi:thiamine-phosphate pyrophosphorylase